MGVPITFMDKHNPEQFEIIGMGEDNGMGQSGGVWLGGSKSCLVNGKAAFKRIFIRRKQPHIAETEQTSSPKAYQIIEPEMSMVAEPELEYGKK